jgi:hypothetical protein
MRLRFRGLLAGLCDISHRLPAHSQISLSTSSVITVESAIKPVQEPLHREILEQFR